MGSTRRTFLKTAGALSVAAIGGSATTTRAAEPTSKSEAPPKGLTMCNLRRDDGSLGLGVRTKGGILDVTAAARDQKLRVPQVTDDVIRGKDVAGLRKLLAGRTERFLIAPDTARFGPAISAPEKILMMGFNYKQHAAEMNIKVGATPVLFNKFNNALLGHGGTIALPTKAASHFDYEVELVVVIGKTARDVSEADALGCVYGYCTGNDFTARDLQYATTQIMLGKISDGFAPIGPWVVSADQVKDPQKLKLWTRVNGELRQNSSTDDMIFTCAKLVSYISSVTTLKPGDIIYTGTPQGVVYGMPKDKQVWLKAGDKVACEVEGLGELRFSLANPVA